MGWRRDFNPPNSLTQEQIDEIIYRHRRMCGDIKTKAGEYESCEFADFREAYLLDCDFRGKFLKFAELSGSVFGGSDFSDSILTQANLERSCFDSCNLSGADLRLTKCYRTDFTNSICRNANFRGSLLIRCDFINADLSYCDFTDADVSECNFEGANLTGVIGLFCPLVCPDEGAFVGWQKAFDYGTKSDCIVKLMIYDDARRTSGSDRECRCDKAKVLAIFDRDGNEINPADCEQVGSGITFAVGETVSVTDFAEDRWNRGNGIRFYITREEAERS